MVQNSMSDDLGVIPGVMSEENITAHSSFLKCRRIVSMHLKNKAVTTRSTGREFLIDEFKDRGTSRSFYYFLPHQ